MPDVNSKRNLLSIFTISYIYMQTPWLMYIYIVDSPKYRVSYGGRGGGG